MKRVVVKFAALFYLLGSMMFFLSTMLPEDT